jgi:hypothetical protein
VVTTKKKKPAAKAPAKKKSAAKRAPKKAPKRTKWLDPKTKSPLIDDYARQMGSFLKAVADGDVDAAEVKAQEARLVKLMKRIEPKLDDDLHAQVTELLCELTVYDMMQVMTSLSDTRPPTRFRG